jgi:hypothetical protein
MSANLGDEQNYEFSDQQNTVINSLSSFMKIFGIICVAGGVLMILGSLMIVKAVSGDQLQAVFVIILGVLQYQASAAFRSVAKTQGNDIHHLMNALTILKNVYKVQVIVVIAAFVMAIVLALFTAGKA